MGKLLSGFKWLGLGAVTRPQVARDPGWASLRRQWLSVQSACQCCGTQRLVEVHHIVPVSIDRSRELDVSNLITLCDGPNECHRIWGHFFDWSDWNPDVVRDVSDFARRRHWFAVMKGGGKYGGS